MVFRTLIKPKLLLGKFLLGEFHQKWRIRVHYHCLLLTSNLFQKGEDDEGIFGFMEEDVRKEEARIRKQKCYICKERHANISCCAKKCRRTFHTVCGIQNGCLSHYKDTFQSWCDRHVALVDEVKHCKTETCGICYVEMGPYRKLESIRAPCCQNGWFHRSCLAQFADSAGYFFKCPLCNNKDDFCKQMLLRGIFIPEKDASWELEPNAFIDQLERPSECDAEECHCRYGRYYDGCKRWELILCATCGSTCRHNHCMEVPSKDYVCTFCRPVVGEWPLEAVLKLVEASRVAKTDSDSNSSETFESSWLPSTSSCSSSLVSLKAKASNDGREESSRDRSPNRRLSISTSTSNGKETSLEELVKKIPLPPGTSIENPVLKIEKLSSEKLKSLTSMVELQSTKEVFRSGTDKFTDASARQETVLPKTPVQESLAQQFKVKLLGSKTLPRKRSISESDPEQVPVKKSCPSTDQQPSISKSRLKLFPSNDEKENNTGPNRPMKAEPIVAVERSVSPITSLPGVQKQLQRQSVFPPTPPPSSSDSSDSDGLQADRGDLQQQRTMNSSFKKTSAAEESSAASAPIDVGGSSSSGSAVASGSRGESAALRIVRSMCSIN